MHIRRNRSCSRACALIWFFVYGIQLASKLDGDSAAAYWWLRLTAIGLDSVRMTKEEIFKVTDILGRMYVVTLQV